MKIIKAATKYLIDRNKIRRDSIVEYKYGNREDFVRGLVKYVDQDSIKIIRSLGTQELFSATEIARKEVEIKVILY